MARACPKCKRPNSDLAERCLYCGAKIPESLPTPAPRAEEKPTAPSRKQPGELYKLILSPRQKLEGKELARFMKELGLDRYTALQKLQQPAPWVVFVSRDSKAAQERAGWLQSLGLDCYVVKQSGLDKLKDRIQVFGLKSQEPERTVFLDREGNEVPLEHDDIFLVVRGKITEKAERELEGGEEAPAVRLVPAEETEQGGKKEPGRLRKAVARLEVKPRLPLLRLSLSKQSMEIADFYRKSSSRAIRIMESEFDYSGLGEEMSPSGLLNFTRIVNRILENASPLAVDTTFNLVGYTMPDVPKEDKIRMELGKEAGTSEEHKKIYDNRALFDDFSARIFLHYLRKSKQGQ